jgi:hypothetical protein
MGVAVRRSRVGVIVGVLGPAVVRVGCHVGKRKQCVLWVRRDRISMAIIWFLAKIIGVVLLPFVAAFVVHRASVEWVLLQRQAAAEG